MAAASSSQSCHPTIAHLSSDARSSQHAEERAAPNQHARASECGKIPAVAGEGRSFGNGIVTMVPRQRVAHESCRSTLARRCFLFLQIKDKRLQCI